jgi:hypothetical protein
MPQKPPKDGYEKVDAAEEAYFNDTDDDDSNEESVVPRPIDDESSLPLEFKRSLVDYPDDDDDDFIKARPVVKQQPKMKISLSLKDSAGPQKQKRHRKI